MTDVLLSGGSFDTFQVGVNSSGPISNRSAYQFGVIGTTSDGYVDYGDLQRLSLASSLLHIDYSRDHLVNPANSFGPTFNPVTWRVGSIYDITQAIAAYAQITNGVDPLGSLITTPLSQRDAKLTTAMQYEVGLKSQFLGGRAQTTLALYYLTKKNLLSDDPTDPNVVQQVGKQSAYGIEVAAGLRLTSYLSLNANAALLNARFDDFTESDGDVTVSRDGKQPPDVPEQMANVWAVITPTDMWRLGAGLRYVGKRYADNANTVREPSYTFLDAFVTFAPVRFLNLTLRGRNLTDDTYAISSYGPTQFIPSEPRVIELVANMRF